eukprot:TRINITY_DN24319_c2_g1_i1.p1 TRINITY_DN24319_c2_g1~~TRINITY_DN24319_c2_g1_i1.p1  ORF type:complete len:251 (-),score=39.86 TRINITY_DN24319_c2_g1_i1:606-1358(-)
MDRLRRWLATLCGKLPGTYGLAGYVACCVLPCQLLLKRCGRNEREDAEEDALINNGTRQVLLLGLDGSGKSSFLWMCEHPFKESLAASGGDGCAEPPTSSTMGVNRLTRKAIAHPAGGFTLDMDLCEVGGGAQIRPYWAHYITRKTAVIAFFVDASAPHTFSEAGQLLANTCEAARKVALSAKIVLVASKVDAAQARSESEVFQAVFSEAEKSLPSVQSAVRTFHVGLVKADSARRSADALLGELVSQAA